MRTFKTNCDNCIVDLMFEDNENCSVPTLISVKNRGGLITAPDHVQIVMKAVEATVRAIVSNSIIPKNAHAIIMTQALGYVLNNNVHKRFSCAIHSTSVIREVIKRYTKIRLKHEASKLDGPVIRSKLSRLVIFSHV